MNRYRATSIVLVAAIFVMAVLTITVGVNPQQQKIKAANSETEQVQAQNDALQQQIDTLMIAEPHLQHEKDLLSQAQRQVPSSYNQQDFIHSINDAATATGVVITNLSFSDATLASLPTLATSQLTIGVPVQVPVQIDATGTYDQLRSFVEETQKITRISVPNSLTYEMGEGGAAGPDCSVSMQSMIWSMLTNSEAVSGDSATDANQNANTASNS